MREFRGVEASSNCGGRCGSALTLSVVFVSMVLLASLIPARSATAQTGGTIVPTSPPFQAEARTRYPVLSLFEFIPDRLFEPLNVRYTATGGLVLITDEKTSKGGMIAQEARIKGFEVRNYTEISMSSLITHFQSFGAEGSIVVELTGFVTLPGLNVKEPRVIRAVLPVKVLPKSATTSTTSAVVNSESPPSSIAGSPGNVAPIASSSQVTVGSGSSAEVILRASDPEGSLLTFAIAQFPSNGKLSGQAPRLVYTPDPGFVGTDALSFTASDGAASSSAATITITVTVARAPAASAAARAKSKPKRTIKKKTKVTVAK